MVKRPTKDTATSSSSSLASTKSPLSSAKTKKAPAAKKKAPAAKKSAPKTAAKSVTKKEITDEQIGVRAHQIWLDEGRPEGRSEQHWQQACQELRGK